MVAIKWSDVKSFEYHLSIAIAATVPNVEDEKTIFLFDDDDDSYAVQYNLQMEGHATDDDICDDSTESESDIDSDDDDKEDVDDGKAAALTIRLRTMTMKWKLKLFLLELYC